MADTTEETNEAGEIVEPEVNPFGITVSETKSTSVKVNFKLPFGYSNAEYRILFRSNKLFKARKEFLSKCSNEMTKANVDFNMKKARNMAGGKQDQTSAHREYMDFQSSVIKPIQDKIRESDKEYKANVFELFGKEIDESHDIPEDGWMIALPGKQESEKFQYYPLCYNADYEGNEKITGAAKSESVTLSVTDLPSNTLLDVSISAKLPTSKKWGSKTKPISLWTPADTWQLVLEKKGLHAVVPIFLKNKMTNPSAWADMTEERSNELGLDPAAVSQIQEIVVSLGILTKSEVGRIKLENIELEKNCKEFGR